MDMTWVKHQLTGKILPFWQGLRDEAQGGWYGGVDFDLHVDEDAVKGCILNSRILWSFSTAARVLKDDCLLEDARRALRFMERFEDKANGGVYWSVRRDGQVADSTKHTYCQAFAIYGLAAYVRATGDAAALSRAMDLFRVIEQRCRDEEGYGEAYRADFSPESNEKLSENGVMASRTMNTLLHVIEAYAELYRAGGREEVREAGAWAIRLLLNKMYNPVKRRLEVFFDQAYRPLLDMQSYGHDIEASWLIWDAAETLLPQAEREAVRAMCVSLAGSVLERAMTENGLLNECVDGVKDETRVWWVQAEAVLGFDNAFRLTGEERFAEARDRMLDAIDRIIVDHREGGEWFWSADAACQPIHKPIVEEWKCPYHNSRMCLRLIRLSA